jgi:hypothetical protein
MRLKCGLLAVVWTIFINEGRTARSGWAIAWTAHVGRKGGAETGLIALAATLSAVMAVVGAKWQQRLKLCGKRGQ